ncbi:MULTISPECIES: TMEM165/GDT1 family protein [Synechococcaceae]|jgi:putative Ca2+/H+ antiporter (TMEM165/GDT1 family)|uniref:TMEM165/GDT1 family protein n=1 Tax=Synechococcaceae TaxID=1890426 RepID=UPI001FF93CE5|nr:TMEM165/GDT1 family protein [Synechococcus sp. NB0720_010]UPH90637.1 TMEM165/GDT1 family protein [Synechococcus sp. NB0720_010]
MPESAPSSDTPQPESTQPQSKKEEKAASFGAVFLTTFTTVFLAELGDKTQLAALLLSAESGRPVLVFIGASLALISSSLVGVVLGRWLSRVLPPGQLERLAGILMIALGLWLGRQAAVSMFPLA